MPELSMNEIKLTDNAKSQLKSLQDSESEAVGIRLFLTARGCAGNEYAMAYVTEANKVETDYTLNADGAVLYIPQENLIHFFQMEIDYGIDALHNESFIYRNPNVRNACGCGSSVNFDEDEDMFA